LEPSAYRWLVDNCTVDETHNVAFTSVHRLSDTSPLKDFFMKYHPVASRAEAQRSLFLGPAKTPEKHGAMLQKAPIHDITALKIHRPKGARIKRTSDTDS